MRIGYVYGGNVVSPETISPLTSRFIPPVPLRQKGPGRTVTAPATSPRQMPPTFREIQRGAQESRPGTTVVVSPPRSFPIRPIPGTTVTDETIVVAPPMPGRGRPVTIPSRPVTITETGTTIVVAPPRSFPLGPRLPFDRRPTQVGPPPLPVPPQARPPMTGGMCRQAGAKLLSEAKYWTARCSEEMAGGRAVGVQSVACAKMAEANRKWEEWEARCRALEASEPERPGMRGRFRVGQDEESPPSTIPLIPIGIAAAAGVVVLSVLGVI